MKHFNRTEKTLKGLIDVILGGSHDVVRTLKAAGHMSQKSVNHALEGRVSLPQFYCLFRSALMKKHGSKAKQEFIAQVFKDLEADYQELYPDDEDPLEGVFL